MLSAMINKFTEKPTQGHTKINEKDKARNNRMS